MTAVSFSRSPAKAGAHGSVWVSAFAGTTWRHGFAMTPVDFRTDPSRYRHWRLACDGAVATLTLDVDPAGGLYPGTELKLNSYDLGVDIELADAVQRLRFEHPEVRAVVIRSGKDNVFCAGANIGALAKIDTRRQGQFLQVHQRDAAGDRGRLGELRPALPRRGERGRGRRRL